MDEIDRVFFRRKLEEIAFAVAALQAAMGDGAGRARAPRKAADRHLDAGEVWRQRRSAPAPAPREARPDLDELRARLKRDAQDE